MLYPLKFKTIFKDKIWGGEKIKTYLGKDFAPLPNCGETWEISGVKSDVSIIANGPLTGTSLADLLTAEKGELIGKKNYERFGNEFPMLVKFIDANEDLSIQVHPDDELAQKRHNSKGKTEMWYVLQADEGSSLISGFNQEVDKELYLKKFNAGELTDILNKEEVNAGDVFFLPAGRVHTIGKGLLIAEIQQTSDITYRIYDFDRKDDQGNTRELHVEEALDAIDYTYHKDYKTKYNATLNQPIGLVDCPYFTTNILEYNKDTTRDYSIRDSFVIHVCVEGSYILKYGIEELPIQMGDCVLIPATTTQVVLQTTKGFKILESYID
ncbi:MAG TPA: type I phosphomannose isomerase catalytic subunit [Pelobium sp.]|nr:type I phosphomannose isomerase catalytic subunit [Pelobium sp.]